MSTTMSVEAESMVTVMLSSDDSDPSSPCDQFEQSFSSIASSVGPLFTPRTDSLVVKGSNIFVESSEDEGDEEEDEFNDGAEETPTTLAERERQERRSCLRYGPTRADRSHDRQCITAAHQNSLNKSILRLSKEAMVGRKDHQIMLRQLISVAYYRDPHRVANRQLWRKIMAAIGKEYYGSKAIFSLSPDPYESVIAKLSSMMLWDGNIRQWAYGYCDAEMTRRRNAQVETLSKLQESGKLFL
ncbi:hypothetical protein ABB37_03066 [Leptomonas pyrrhocoris]|uniref:Uncharacterized protein n=1 Tax=Leptomonas pyrrhocoris TaxID=157538 RepID=A0A0M9G6I5_LEPPY|nr:hypothetical protein ABB37_03066 [Leptomonas pyrrhocoris]KPA83437.1 hypothetical protein ABB37_03066 [Leptomonas pyrrhocoris]|eukprot:XP_015661876.1 hypothetical protein ABB37_03066 [Leptomonas pyrrhocoris]